MIMNFQTYSVYTVPYVFQVSCVKITEKSEQNPKPLCRIQKKITKGFTTVKVVLNVTF